MPDRACERRRCESREAEQGGGGVKFDHTVLPKLGLPASRHCSTVVDLSTCSLHSPYGPFEQYAGGNGVARERVYV